MIVEPHPSWHVSKTMNLPNGLRGRRELLHVSAGQFERGKGGALCTAFLTCIRWCKSTDAGLRLAQEMQLDELDAWTSRACSVSVEQLPGITSEARTQREA
jgi:hypothetical protein